MHATEIPAGTTAIRVGGTWLAAASLLMIAALGLHGPIPPEMSDRMTHIAGQPTVWSVVHWMAAAGLSLYAVAGLVVLTSASRLTGRGWTTTAWAVLTVGALWTVTTAIAEATAMTGAAIAGNADLFAFWWSFAQGNAHGFAILALAVAVIARDDAQRPEAITPAWAAHTGSLAGMVSFAGWALGMWFGVPIGNLIWVAASILMSVWTLWFGVGLIRAPEGQWVRT